MNSKYSKFLILFLLIFLPGCAHVISRDLRTKAHPPLSLSQVRDNPEIFKGRWVVWGGEIIETINQKDGTTQIEVFQKPLGWRGEPKETNFSEGRFLALIDEYLDPYLFRRGRRITVAGEITGEMIKPLGEMDYHYPVVSSKQIFLWPLSYYYYSVYPFMIYDPWWWGYPHWRGSFGFYYHYHLHPRHR